MIEIGGRPILWHILKTYSHHGINEFIICVGYKGHMIKEYFSNYFLHNADVTFHLSRNDVTVHHDNAEPWKVTVVDTGTNSMTGGRLKRVAPYIGDEDFCLTYGDGVGDVDIRAGIEFHKSHNGLATVTAVQPRDRFGLLSVTPGGVVDGFIEKPKDDGKWINAGYFVLSPGVMDYIAGDDTIWEQKPMESLAADRQLHAFPHRGFWHAMDTMRDKAALEEMWEKNAAPWKVWGEK